MNDPSQMREINHAIILTRDAKKMFCALPTVTSHKMTHIVTRVIFLIGKPFTVSFLIGKTLMGYFHTENILRTFDLHESLIESHSDT
jgi:hypothetical protein